MTNKEFNEVISKTRTYQKWEELQKPPVIPPPLKVVPKKNINWAEREMHKNKMLLKYALIILGVFLASCVFVVMPMWIVYPPYGKSILMAMPPMAFFAASWMLGAWWAWDRGSFVFMAATLGAMPLRLAFGVFWTVFVWSIPDFPKEPFFLSLMAYWIVFTVPEIAMVLEFSKLESTEELKSEA